MSNLHYDHNVKISGAAATYSSKAPKTHTPYSMQHQHSNIAAIQQYSRFRAAASAGSQQQQHAACRKKLFAREAIWSLNSLSRRLAQTPKMSNLHYNHNVKTSGSRVSICSHLHYNHNVKTSGSGVSRVQSTL